MAPLDMAFALLRREWRGRSGPRLKSFAGLPRWGCTVLVLFLSWAIRPGSIVEGSPLPSRDLGFSSARDFLLFPELIELHGADDRHGILVSANDESGRDVTQESRFGVDDRRIVEVDAQGVCRPMTDGETDVLVTWNHRVRRVHVRVRGSQETVIPSFRQDIEPLLTRLGCNQGACHGKLAGQNGFRLSLRAYAPEMDHRWLTEEVTGRRINPAAPSESLLLTKPTGLVPHEGLVRFAVESRYHRTLLEWISARAPGPRTIDDEKDAIRLEILPGDRVLEPGMSQQLLARAHWPDGAVRDVTWLTQFFSNDEATARVSPEGLVKALRPGETSVRAHFQGLVEVVRLTIPYTNHVDAAMFSRAQNGIDPPVFGKLQALHLPPSELTDDLTFLRRATLDATGTLPTSESIHRFLSDSRPDKRHHLVSELLERPEFVDYWTLVLADLLQNRKERDHDVRGRKGVVAFHGWLREQVAAHRPWNELVRSVITAEGDTVRQPAVGYYVTLVGEKDAAESEIPDAVAQAFLGTRIGCARCHNHPLEKYTQDDFYHFAAFFSRVHLDRKEPAAGATVLRVASREESDRQRELEDAQNKRTAAQTALLMADRVDPKLTEDYVNRRAEYAERKRQLHELATRRPVTLQPRTHQMVEARPLDRVEVRWQPGEDPRIKLADWITATNNEAFAGAIVNRVWKHYFGVGIVEPVDDLRASNPPSNPALWRFLKQEFVGHGYDLRHLMSLIMNSRTYQLSSATCAGNETDRKFHSHYYARRMPAEVLADAVSQATGVPDHYDGMPLGLRAIQLPEPNVSSYFLSLFGRSERVTACACERMGEVTLPQLLNLHNGEEIGRKIHDQNGRIKDWLDRKLDREATVEEMYQVTLGRQPTGGELDGIRRAWGDTHDEEALRDLFWALLNTKEFAFIH